MAKKNVFVLTVVHAVLIFQKILGHVRKRTDITMFCRSEPPVSFFYNFVICTMDASASPRTPICNAACLPAPPHAPAREPRTVRQQLEAGILQSMYEGIDKHLVTHGKQCTDATRRPLQRAFDEALYALNVQTWEVVGESDGGFSTFFDSHTSIMSSTETPVHKPARRASASLPPDAPAFPAAKLVVAHGSPTSKVT